MPGTAEPWSKKKKKVEATPVIVCRSCCFITWSEEGSGRVVGCLDVCRRRTFKVNASKTKLPRTENGVDKFRYLGVMISRVIRRKAEADSRVM